MNLARSLQSLLGTTFPRDFEDSAQLLGARHAFDSDGLRQEWPMLLNVFGLVLPWLFVALGAWLVWQLMAQNGRIVLRLEAIEARLAHLSRGQAESSGLAPGSPAPDFELADLSGARRKLDEFRGKRLLLTFFHPLCGYCNELAPDLAELSLGGSEADPLPVVVSGGSAEENGAVVEEFGFRFPVLLSEPDETISARYEVRGTPTSYLVDEQGRIASPRAVGRDAILALVPQYKPLEIADSSSSDDRSGSDEKVGTNGQPGRKKPRMVRQAWNLAQAMSAFVADGFKTLSEDQYRVRLETCDACDRREGSRCTECGCYLRLKARGRAFDCPLGKWPAIEPEPASSAG